MMLDSIESGTADSLCQKALRLRLITEHLGLGSLGRHVKLNEGLSECGINAFINMRCIAFADV